MSGNIDSEQWQNFNQRLTYWIFKQGFWFQLKYSLFLGGKKPGLMLHFVHLTLRLVIFLIFGGLVWVGVVKFTGEEKFTKLFSDQVEKKFAADEIEIQGVSRERGKFTIFRLAMIADKSSFFTGLELSNLVCQRDFFVDFGRTWKPGLVEISKANLSLRAGADSEESAQAIAGVLFQEMGNLRPDAIHVANMSMRWGFTERSRGSITASKMKAIPQGDGWKLSFRGGTFSQNWLRELQIERLDVLVSKQGIKFEEAVFSKDGGLLVLEEFDIVAGYTPKVSGKMKMKSMSISSMLPVVARAYVDGKISGNFEVAGSTNTTEGITFDGEVILENGDVITLRDRISLLRALTVVDANNNYRRMDFKTGSFKLKFQEKGLMISDVKMFADDKMSLIGDMFVRKPKADEELVLDDGSDFFGETVKEDDLAKDINISLLEAGKDSNDRESGFETDDDKSLFGKLAIMSINRRILEYEAEKLSQSYRYEGEFKITLMQTAFDRAPELKAVFPGTADGGRIPISVPIQGVLYELTEGIAKQLYEKGRR
ncbi:MAG: hypothetical protein ACK5G9_06265 [Akkermansiaceae bacterium]|jgi:hypothetical protein